jgi:hypothetical protein
MCFFSQVTTVVLLGCHFFHAASFTMPILLLFEQGGIRFGCAPADAGAT